MNDAALSPLLNAIDAGNDEEAEDAVLALCANNGNALPLLATLAQAPVDDYRWWAVRGLAELSEEDAAQREAAMPILLEALHDPDDAIRCLSATALGQMNATGAIPALTILLSDSSGWVRGAAADGLAMIGEPAIPALGAAIQDDREGVRVRAARALYKIKSPKAAPWLFPALNDPNPIVHTYAYETLDELGLLTTVLVM
jgi:HEAT repeat protein